MSDTSTDTTADQADASTASDSQPTQADIDKLNTAIARERDLRKEAERQAKDGKTATQRLAELEAANATDLEKAVKAARDEGKTEAVQAANARLVRAEARALAAEIGFSDPLDAIALVDLSDIKVTDDGDVDGDAVKKELAALAEKKKYLLKTAQDTSSSSDAGIGTSGNAVTDGSPQSLIRQGLAGTSKTK